MNYTDVTGSLLLFIYSYNLHTIHIETMRNISQSIKNKENLYNYEVCYYIIQYKHYLIYINIFQNIK
jgi:hypothetical protein